MAKIIIDQNKVVRFKGNEVVKDLLDMKMDLNQITRFYQEGRYSFDDFWEFYQLIGYSLGGYQELVSQNMMNKDE